MTVYTLPPASRTHSDIASSERPHNDEFVSAHPYTCADLQNFFILRDAKQMFPVTLTLREILHNIQLASE
jgi:hypothetical protein